MGKEVAVIGGGVIGLCCAYFLQKAGNQVTIIDQSGLDQGASYVNAGYLSPSHIIPLSAPGVMKKGLRWMFNRSSPLYIKPRFDMDLLRWAWAFNRSCNPKHVKKAVPAIKEISIFSQQLFEEIIRAEKFTSHMEKKGLLMLCKTEKMLREEIKVAEIAMRQGLEVSVLNAGEIRNKEPNVKLNTIGATYYECDWHTTPHEFMNEMKMLLRNLGVGFLLSEKVVDLKNNDNSIEGVITDRRLIKADDFVLASGAWTNLLSKRTGIRLLMQAGKGYRIDSSKESGISIPAILAERKVAVTPMNGFTRFAGTMEIAGIDHKVNNIRVKAIAEGVHQYYPEVILSEGEKANAACGLRPVTPDGLAYIGRPSKCKNLVIAAGHAMMGWSMATGTGKLVEEVINDKKSSLDLIPFSPDRKF